MKITFSFNQVQQIQLIAFRRNEAYGLIRNARSIPVGDFFDPADALTALLGDSSFERLIDESGDVMVRFGDVVIDLNIAHHAFLADLAINDIQHMLNAFIRGEVSLSTVQKTVRKAKTLIDATEW